MAFILISLKSEFNAKASLPPGACLSFSWASESGN